MNDQYDYDLLAAHMRFAFEHLAALAGDIVGTPEDWTSNARHAAKHLRVMADQLDKSRDSRGPIVFPSPAEILERAMAG